MSSTKPVHQHKFTSWEYMPIAADNTKFAGYGAELPHFGQVVPTALLYRTCGCGHKEAAAFGDRKRMKALLERLTVKQEERV